VRRPSRVDRESGSTTEPDTVADDPTLAHMRFTSLKQVVQFGDEFRTGVS
jgi:hypothetical protein